MISSDTAVGSLFVADTVCKVRSLLDKANFLYQWTCINSQFVWYDSEWHYSPLVFSWSLNFYYSLLFSSSASTSEHVTLAAVSSFLAVSSSWCGYHYEWYDLLFGLLFSGFLFTLIILLNLSRVSVMYT